MQHQRRALVRQLNDTEERLAALHLAEKLLRTNRSRAVVYAEAILRRDEEFGARAEIVSPKRAARVTLASNEQQTAADEKCAQPLLLAKRGRLQLFEKLTSEGLKMLGCSPGHSIDRQKSDP